MLSCTGLNVDVASDVGADGVVDAGVDGDVFVDVDVDVDVDVHVDGCIHVGVLVVLCSFCCCDELVPLAWRGVVSMLVFR